LPRVSAHVSACRIWRLCGYADAPLYRARIGGVMVKPANSQAQAAAAKPAMQAWADLHILFHLTRPLTVTGYGAAPHVRPVPRNVPANPLAVATSAPQAATPTPCEQAPGIVASTPAPGHPRSAAQATPCLPSPLDKPVFTAPVVSPADACSGAAGGSGARAPAGPACAARAGAAGASTLPHGNHGENNL